MNKEKSFDRLIVNICEIHTRAEIEAVNTCPVCLMHVHKQACQEREKLRELLSAASESLQEVVALSNRKTDVWDKARVIIAMVKGTWHGVTCPKVEHVGLVGQLHAPDDDTPYDVDGASYCGRCHQAL